MTAIFRIKINKNAPFNKNHFMFCENGSTWFIFQILVSSNFGHFNFQVIVIKDLSSWLYNTLHYMLHGPDPCVTDTVKKKNLHNHHQNITNTKSQSPPKISGHTLYQFQNLQNKNNKKKHLRIYCIRPYFATRSRWGNYH